MTGGQIVRERRQGEEEEREQGRREAERETRKGVEKGSGESTRGKEGSILL